MKINYKPYDYKGVSTEAMQEILMERDREIDILRSMLINYKLYIDKDYVHIADAMRIKYKYVDKYK